MNKEGGAFALKDKDGSILADLKAEEARGEYIEQLFKDVRLKNKNPALAQQTDFRTSEIIRAIVRN